MGKIRFGKSQLTNPTPTRVGAIIDVTSAIAGVLVSSLTAAPADVIDAHTATVWVFFLGMYVGIAQVLKPFFGVKPLSGKVDAGDVTEMETP